MFFLSPWPPCSPPLEPCLLEFSGRCSPTLELRFKERSGQSGGPSSIEVDLRSIAVFDKAAVIALLRGIYSQKGRNAAWEDRGEEG